MNKFLCFSNVKNFLVKYKSNEPKLLKFHKRNKQNKNDKRHRDSSSSVVNKNKNKMPAERINLKGYESFKSAVEKITGKKEINVYFSGSKNDKGVSWCSDCVSAEPHVMTALEKFGKDDTVFMYVDVGDRPFWKDMKNPFRTDKDIHIQVIPTLIRWKEHQRLEGDQCEKSDLLQMFFSESDD